MGAVVLGTNSLYCIYRNQFPWPGKRTNDITDRFVYRRNFVSGAAPIGLEARSEVTPLKREQHRNCDSNQTAALRVLLAYGFASGSKAFR